MRYSGTGYNILKGNPEGDLKIRGRDPGLEATREVFAHTYSKKEVYYGVRMLQIPDQISFHASHSCAAQHSERAISGRKSYSEELEGSVSLSGNNNIIVKNGLFHILLYTPC